MPIDKDKTAMQYHHDHIARILASRAGLGRADGPVNKSADEGGCGVTGFIASVPVAGRHIHEPSIQMHNRGNGKGGGIAALGLCAADLGVSQEMVDSHYLLQVALMDPSARREVEAAHIDAWMDVATAGQVATVDDFREVEGLEVKPPDVWRYFVRVKPAVLERFVAENGLERLDPRRAEDEFIYQNSTRLNQTFYAARGAQRAFVLSHGRNLMILKIVGYAEKVVEYYRLQDFKAHGWIAHQRYPTKGRVWHPGGAHPFSGLNEALVHNGDFANYYAVCEYLKQFNLFPQFLTDTEVSVMLIDLLHRTFGYPMEYVIEALAPTSEYDFDQLPEAKQRIYRAIQSSHIHASPDGPWFFIIARNNPYKNFLQLIGITDTAMLRPQVFALQEGKVQIGLICSEKQAIDATLQSLAAEDSRFCPVADKYWNARGGSATDGGAFLFTVTDAGKGDGTKKLVCTTKFGQPVTIPAGQVPEDRPADVRPGSGRPPEEVPDFSTTDGPALASWAAGRLEALDYPNLRALIASLVSRADGSDAAKAAAIDLLTHLNDRVLATGRKKRAAVLDIVRSGLTDLFSASDRIASQGAGAYRFIDWQTRGDIRPPRGPESVLVINARDFPPEGDDCDARLICRAHQLGWRRFVCFGYKGQRFTGCGLSKDTQDVRIDVYDSSGDYLASGIDGLEIHVHGNAQDQVGQILKRGKLVIHGDVGQTFLYGAKGGEVYVMGNAAGRPLINAVGRPRVVINGTCLDYLAESFMAGDPLNGGGFVILNAMAFDHQGQLHPQATPYPGSNLFSLASGGAIYIRDPGRVLSDEQLNGGEFVDLAPADWALILPYLKENERLFGISITADLLTVDGRRLPPAQVYRKVQPAGNGSLAKAASAMEEWGAQWEMEASLN
jgi:glutamate synthase domain-containing protein 1